jgi:drug/metabolite transporter (DMT)-like permease
MPYLGETAAVCTTIFWTITSIAFEIASKRVGSLVVNVTRLFVAFVLISVFAYFQRGLLFPTDADSHTWIWLSISAVVGFVIGDFCLFKAFAVMNSRISQLFMTLVPPMAAFTGWIMLGERMNLFNFLGMSLTITGIVFAITARKNADHTIKKKIPLNGILFALGGAVGQAVGLVISKYGMGNYNPFAATQIRILTGIVGFCLIATFFRRWKNVADARKDKAAIKGILIGSVFGPFLGVSFSLIAVQHTSAAVASTIMATVPVLIIVPSIFIFKHKVTVREIIGAIISVLGIIIFFIKGLQ